MSTRKEPRKLLLRMTRQFSGGRISLAERLEPRNKCSRGYNNILKASMVSLTANKQRLQHFNILPHAVLTVYAKAG